MAPKKKEKKEHPWIFTRCQSHLVPDQFQNETKCFGGSGIRQDVERIDGAVRRPGVYILRLVVSILRLEPIGTGIV